MLVCGCTWDIGTVWCVDGEEIGLAKHFSEIHRRDWGNRMDDKRRKRWIPGIVELFSPVLDLLKTVFNL